MQLITHIREALRNLLYAKMRSFLAILGIVVGTGSVVALIMSSQLATRHALQQFKVLGTHVLTMELSPSPQVSPWINGQLGVQQSQLQKTFKHFHEIKSWAPFTVIYRSTNLFGTQRSMQVMASTHTMAKIADMHLKLGRWVGELDVNSYYCDVGINIAKHFQKLNVNPIGQQILVDHTYFTIVGVLDHWQPNLFVYVDMDNGLFIPLSAMHSVDAESYINSVIFKLNDPKQLLNVQAQIKQDVLSLLPNWQISFRNPQQIINVVSQQRQTFTWLLGAIGGIALVVGGIGVMNIMLVSVIERRREIGIRLAVGAQRQDILLMFLMESIILTIFGGIVGIILGVVVSAGIAVISHWGFALYMTPIFLGFIVSAVVGIFSGLYPAFNASRQDPVKSLGND